MRGMERVGLTRNNSAVEINFARGRTQETANGAGVATMNADVRQFQGGCGCLSVTMFELCNFLPHVLFETSLSPLVKTQLHVRSRAYVKKRPDQATQPVPTCRSQNPSPGGEAARCHWTARPNSVGGWPNISPRAEPSNKQTKRGRAHFLSS